MICFFFKERNREIAFKKFVLTKVNIIILEINILNKKQIICISPLFLIYIVYIYILKKQLNASKMYIELFIC